MARTYIDRIKANERARTTVREAQSDLEELADGGESITRRLLDNEPVNPRETRVRVLTLRAVRAYDRGIREFTTTLEQISLELGDDESTHRRLTEALKEHFA